MSAAPAVRRTAATAGLRGRTVRGFPRRLRRARVARRRPAARGAAGPPPEREVPDDSAPPPPDAPAPRRWRRTAATPHAPAGSPRSPTVAAGAGSRNENEARPGTGNETD